MGGLLKYVFLVFIYYVYLKIKFKNKEIMLLKIKDAFLAHGVFLTFHFKVLFTFIIKIFFTVIKHPMFTLFCKLVFFTSIILIVNMTTVPFCEKNIFFTIWWYISVTFFIKVHFYTFQVLLRCTQDILKLKTLANLLNKRVEELSTFSTSLSDTHGEVLKNLSEFFTFTSWMKNDI